MVKKFKDYVKLIPKAIKNYDKILEGISNNESFKNGELTEEEAAEIIRRRVICSECPYLSTNVEGYKSNRAPHCVLCGCDEDFKTACLSCNCGIETYNKENSDNKMELKWKSFKTDSND